MTSLRVAKVSAGTVYKLIASGAICGFIPLGVLFGVLGFLGLSTLNWNNQPITGASALYAGPLIGLFIALIFTVVFGSVVAFGLWLLSFFRSVTIEYAPLTGDEQAGQ